MTAEWHQLSDEAKQPYRKQTEDQKTRYDAEMKVYKVKKAEADAVAAANAANIKKVATAADTKLSGKKRPASKSAEKKDKSVVAAAKEEPVP